MRQNARAEDLDFGFAPEEQLGILLPVVIEEFVGASGGRACCRSCIRSRQMFCYSGNEYITVLRNRLDVARVGSVIAELLADVLDALSQSRIGYEDAVPNLVKDALLFHELPALPDQQEEDVK